MALLASKSQFVHQNPTHLLSAQPPASMFSQPSPTNSEFSEGPGLLDDIRSWDERKVAEWLRSINCQKYDTIFEKNNITGETLLECDHSVLKELGITKVGDRVRIFVAVKALRTKAYGTGKKRNRDTLAALDNVGPMPNYRVPSQHQSHLSPPVNKRSSRQFESHLSATTYTRPESPTENEYSRSSQSQRSAGARMISPPLESSRSNGSYNPPNSSGTISSNPYTPRDWRVPGSGSPNNPRVRHNPSTSFGDIMDVANVRNKCIKVIGDGGATRVIDMGGCNTHEAVMKRILKKFNITENWLVWGIWSINKEHGRESARCLGERDLLRIVHDISRLERTRLILRRKSSPPSPSSREFLVAQEINREQQDVAQKHAADAIQENAKNPKIKALTGEQPHEIRPTSPMSMSGSLSPISTVASPASPRSRDSNASSLGRKQSKKITAFFGQRPPSEMISSNLAEYFPDHEHKVLEKTVRNSMRRSARMSKWNSRLSVATTRSYASSIGSDVPPVPTVGDTWLNSSPQATALPAVTMNMNKSVRPLSIRRSILPSTSFSEKDFLGAVPENDVSPVRADRKSYMSYDSHESARDSVTIAVTDTESTGSGTYLDRQSMVSTPATDIDTQSTLISQLFSQEESEEEEEDMDMDGNMADMRWMKGTLIGSGSFGSVYLALNALTGELMAVKQVEMPTNAKEDSRKQSMIDALTREIALLKDLQHENIVQYLHSNKEDNCFNIFLEYVPGGSVAAMLNNYGPLKEPLIRNFVRQILAGLAYLHGKNIIHRDIKGANVLVDNKGGIKISDFGISKKVEAGLLTSSAANHRPSLQGSVFWMAPEVVKQTSYTLKADIWSLGCLIVEMFTGSHPYPDCSQLQAIFKIGTGGSAPSIPAKSTAEAKLFLGQTFELDYQKRPTADELLLSPFLLPLVGNGSSD